MRNLAALKERLEKRRHRNKKVVRKTGIAFTTTYAPLSGEYLEILTVKSPNLLKNKR